MILTRISEDTGLDLYQLQKIVTTASYRYRSYSIPKRTGGRRMIHHPTPDLKFLQRWLNRNVFVFLPVHDRAYAYRRGVGIAENAKIHANGRYFMKVDFRDFFPSLRSSDIENVINCNFPTDVMEMDEVDMQVITSIACRRGVLTIGAPSSPILSNAIMYDFDCSVVELCHDRNINYTRYADDLFFSCNVPNVLASLLERIKVDLREREWPNLAINAKKTVFSSKKRRRVATGIVLTPDGELSIGRNMKRKIRTLVYLYSLGKLPRREVSFLRGFLAYVNSIEPKMIVSLRNKFGEDTIDDLFHEAVIWRKRRHSRSLG